MAGSLTSIELRDDKGASMGTVQYWASDGWLSTCAQCPPVNQGDATPDPVEAVRRLVEHIESRHP